MPHLYCHLIDTSWIIYGELHLFLIIWKLGTCCFQSWLWVSFRECSQARETDVGGGTAVKVCGDLWVSVGGHRGLPALWCPLTVIREGNVTCPCKNDHPVIKYLSSTHYAPGTVLSARTLQNPSFASLGQNAARTSTVCWVPCWTLRQQKGNRRVWRAREMHKTVATSPTWAGLILLKSCFLCIKYFDPPRSLRGRRLEESSRLRLTQLGLLDLPLTGESDSPFPGSFSSSVKGVLPDKTQAALLV